LFGDARTDLLVPPAVDIPAGSVPASDEMIAADVALVRNLQRVLNYAGGAVGNALSGRGIGANQGNMILGGPGDDVIRGNAGNDIIHGDAFLDVAYSVPFAGCAVGNVGRLDPFDSNRVIATDLTWIAQAVREGRLNISDVVIRRMIDLGGQKDEGSANYSVDTAVFDGFLDTTTANGSTPIRFVRDGNNYVMNGNEYRITVRGSDKAVLVDDLNAVGDGLDILVGIEKIVFNGTGIPNAGGFNSAPGTPTTLDLRTATGLPANYLISGRIQSGEPVRELLQDVNCTGTSAPVLSGGRVVIPNLPETPVDPAPVDPAPVDPAPVDPAPAAPAPAAPAPAAAAPAAAPTATTVAPTDPIALPSRNNATSSMNSATLLFDNGSTRLNSKAKKELEKMAKEFGNSGATVSIVGFTSGTKSSALVLADNRAKTVARFLRTKGVKAKVQKSLFITGSMSRIPRVVIEWDRNK
jgi:outer membrane protein OmpA-like peptidoglycan-associated protein